MGAAKDDYQHALRDYETHSGKLERARWEYDQEMEEWSNGKYDTDLGDELIKENKKLLKECETYYKQQVRLGKKLLRLRGAWMEERVLEAAAKKVNPKPKKAAKEKRL